MESKRPVHPESTFSLDSYSSDNLAQWVELFLYSCRSRNLAAGTIEFYVKKLNVFVRFCNDLAIDWMNQLTPDAIRRFMIWLEESGHNPGGVHGFYRTVRTFLRWYELEAEPDGWSNPIRKVKPPIVPLEPLDPIPIPAAREMHNACEKDTFVGLRDRAILLFLLDTGARKSEFLALNIQDVDLITGVVQIRSGKGRKPRTAHLGDKSRQALRKYLRKRTDDDSALWIGRSGNRLSESGLQMLLRRKARRAGVPEPSPHDFRRAFALERLRAGVDLLTLSKLMGHESLQVLNRYLKQAGEDLQRVAKMSSPVDLHF